jgi:diguanylate cyclase (GGDEF)-like protein
MKAEQTPRADLSSGTVHVKPLRRRQDGLAILVSLGVAAISGILWFLSDSLAFQSQVAHFFTLLVNCVTVGLAIRIVRLRTTTPEQRLFWRYLAISTILVALGDGVLLVEHFLSALSLIKSLASGLYITGYVVLLAAMYRIFMRELSPSLKARTILDSLVLLCCGLLLGWHSVVIPLFLQPLPILQSIEISAYLITNLTLFFGLSLVMFRRSISLPRTVLRLLTLAILAQIVADSVYIHSLLLVTTTHVHTPDLFWLVSRGFLCAAICWAYTNQHVQPNDEQPLRHWLPQSWYNLMPYVAVVVGYGLLFSSTTTWSIFSGDDILIALITILALIRQIIVLRDNQRLLDESSRLSSQLWRQAFYDPLTGLANRALFQNRLEEALEYHKTEQQYITVMLLDLDSFKTINDSLGHNSGDQLLWLFGHRLQRVVASQTLVARLGDDEFGILLEHQHADEAAVVADLVLTSMERPLVINERTLIVQCSIGIATSCLRYETSAELLRNADTAMHVAKQRGMACAVQFTDEMHAAVLAQLELQTDLQTAFERNQFRLVFQPIMAVLDGSCVGLEALVRWHHPTRGLLSPAEFMPIVERSNLIHTLGNWVLEEACRQSTWLLAQPGTETLQFISVNLSIRQLHDATLLDRIQRYLSEAQLAPHFLKLEITESSAMHNANETIAQLHALKQLGVRLAIDDFGTGYSALSYLKLFPVHTIKLDRTFVQGLGVHSSDAALIEAVIRFAQSLDLRVIAEGVETEEQLQILGKLGCGYCQGYYVSHPLSIDSLYTWLTDRMLQNPIRFPLHEKSVSS